jgi:dCTP diphosphatase
MSNDRTTTIHELRELVQNFVSERDWQQFHLPKNLAMSIAIEAAELMEHFQWSDTSTTPAPTETPKKTAVGEELADVLCYCLALANTLDLDVSQIIRDKMIKNALKYPAAQFQGRSGQK